MRSIKISFTWLCLLAVCWAGFGWVSWAVAQQTGDFDLPGGDITLENILPDDTDITIKVKRITYKEQVFGLTGAVFIGTNDEKAADIEVSFAPIPPEHADKVNAANGDARRIKALVYNVNVASLDDVGLLPIPLPQADDYRLELEFDTYAAGGMSPIAFSIESRILQLAGEFGFDDDFHLTALSADIVRLQAKPFFALADSLLRSDDLSDDLHIQGQFSGQAILRKDGGKIIDVALQADDIIASSQELFPEAQVLKSPDIKAAYDFGKNRLNLQAFDFGIREAAFRATGAVSPRDTGDAGDTAFALQLNMTEGFYDAKDLATDWPLLLAPSPRVWVIENIHAGKAHGLKLALGGSVRGGAPIISDFSAELLTKDGDFTYWDLMPKATTEKALIRFDDNGLSVSSDSIVIADMHGIKSTVHITLPQDGADNQTTIDIDIHQDFEKLAVLLNRPQVELLSRLGLPQEVKGGDFVGQAQLRFPLIRDLDPQDIDFTFAGKLADFYSPETPFGAKLAVDIQHLNIKGNKQNIEISADEINIAQLTGKFHWLIDLGQASDSISSYKIIPVLDENFWEIPLLQPITESLGGISLNEYVSGEAAIEFSVSEADDGSNNLRLNIDLTAAELHIAEFNIRKPKGSYGLLTIDLTKQGNIIDVKDFNYQDADNSIILQADIDTDREHALQKMLVKNFTTPTSDLSAVVVGEQQNGSPAFHVNIKADRLDLIHLFNYALDSSPQEQTDGDTDSPPNISPNAIADMVTPNFEIFVFAEELTGNGNMGEIKHLNFHAKYRDRRLMDMNIAMQIGERTGQVKYGTGTPGNSEGHYLQGGVPNLGTLLRYTGLSERMTGGEMLIDMTTPSALEPIVGDFMVKDFRLREAPILGQLLQLVSAADATAALTGEGIHFKEWESQIAYKDDVLTFSEGNLRGDTVGLSMQGSFNGKNSKIKLRGTVVPFYWISSNIIKLPILSEIFDDDIDDAIFGFRYGVDGNRHEPDVWVNPISILTPGGLKAIFEGNPSGKPAPKGKID